MIAHGRGLALLQLRRWDAAIETYTKALSWEPRDARSFYGRGIAKARKGDRAGAEQDLAQARRYGFATHTEFDDLGISP
jgi:Flp pilus assembly protein TadD